MPLNDVRRVENRITVLCQKLTNFLIAADERAWRALSKNS